MPAVPFLPDDKTNLRGATLTDDGTYFSIYSENATALNVHLYNDQGRETNVIALNSPSDADRAAGNHLWTKMEPGIAAGQRYHLSADGPWVPEQGLRFNPRHLLVDPDAKEFDGSFAGDAIMKEENFGYHWNSPWKDLSPNLDSNARVLPYCVVAAPLSQAGRPARPTIAKEQLMIVEAHVDDTTRGLAASALEGIAPGNVRAMASAPVLDVLNRTKRNAVQMLPVNEFPDEGALLGKGDGSEELKQHWGYNTVAFQAMTGRYGNRADYAAAIDGLHAAGKAVILDVVFNHTAEGDEMGPTFSFKGLDNPTYYDLCADKRYYDKSHTGVGNRLNTNHPEVRRLIVDSLSVMRRDYKVDGFRFDLAPALFLDTHGHFDPKHPLFDEIKQAMDAIDRDEGSVPTFLIAESWDVKANAYGQFPEGWLQQSDAIRDGLRDAAQIDAVSAGDTHRLLYAPKPHDTVSFVTAHDGFTLNDLVSYKDKHNFRNGDGGSDGHDDNHSCNGGVEGPTENPVVNAYRDRVKLRAMFLLHASKTVIMNTMSDIFHRHTQDGNNNSYCRKNTIDWSLRDTAWEAELGRQADIHQMVVDGVSVVPLEMDGHQLSHDAVDNIPSWKKAIGERIEQPDGGDLVVCMNGSGSDVPFELPEGQWEQVAGDQGDRFYARAFKEVTIKNTEKITAAPVLPALLRLQTTAPVDPRPFA